MLLPLAAASRQASSSVLNPLRPGYRQVLLNTTEPVESRASHPHVSSSFFTTKVRETGDEGLGAFPAIRAPSCSTGACSTCKENDSSSSIDWLLIAKQFPLRMVVSLSSSKIQKKCFDSFCFKSNFINSPFVSGDSYARQSSKNERA